MALEYFPKAKKASIDWTQETPEFPTVPGGLCQFEDKVLTILTKIEKLPLDDISRDLRKVLASLDQGLKDVNGMVVNVDGEVRKVMPEVKKTLATLDQSLQNANKILARADAEIVPSVTKTLEDLQRSVAAAERVLANTDTALLGPDAPAQQEMRATMQELSRAARGLRLIADYFERHPESLIRGKNQK